MPAVCGSTEGDLSHSLTAKVLASGATAIVSTPIVIVISVMILVVIAIFAFHYLKKKVFFLEKKI